MPRELNDTAPTEIIGRYKVQINNYGSLLIYKGSTQLYLNQEESRQLLAFLLAHSTENAEEPPAYE